VKSGKYIFFAAHLDIDIAVIYN